MRTVQCRPLGRRVSALGFGCAKLGSTLSEVHARRILEAAFERGVVWYDVGPKDGDGEAAAILGRFAAARRPEIVIAARIGRPWPKPTSFRRLASALKRGVFSIIPELQGATARFAARGEPLRPEGIESGAAETLRRLRTDYVDVLLLENPAPQECADPALLEALARVVSSGAAKSLGVAGAPEAVEAARTSGLFSVLQVRSDPFQPALARVRAALPAREDEFLVLTGPLGAAYERLSRLLVGDGGRLASLASQLAYGPFFMPEEILLDYAFGDNPAGVVVVVTSQLAHLDRNCARATRAPRADTVEFVDKTVLTSQAALAMASRRG